MSDHVLEPSLLATGEPHQATAAGEQRRCRTRDECGALRTGPRQGCGQTVVEATGLGAGRGIILRSVLRALILAGDGERAGEVLIETLAAGRHGVLTDVVLSGNAVHGPHAHRSHTLVISHRGDLTESLGVDIHV